MKNVSCAPKLRLDIHLDLLKIRSKRARAIRKIAAPLPCQKTHKRSFISLQRDHIGFIILFEDTAEKVGIHHLRRDDDLQLLEKVLDLSRRARQEEVTSDLPLLVVRDFLEIIIIVFFSHMVECTLKYG